MRSMAAAIVLISCLGAGPERFPYDAEVVQEDAPVRSGPGGKSSYITSRLHRGEKVRVHRHEPGGWAMITPPPGSFNLVPADAVRTSGPSRGEITGVDVAARMGSEFGPNSENYKVTLSDGDRVEILGEVTMRKSDGRSVRMYKIRPPKNDFRWIEGKSIATERSIARRVDNDEDDPFNEDQKFGVRPAPKPSTKYEDQDRDWGNDTWSRDDDRDGHAEHRHDDDRGFNDSDRGNGRGGSGLRERPIVRTKDGEAVRRSLPEDGEIARERQRLEALDDRFREIVNRPPSQWRFRELEEDYRRLQQEVTVPALASQVQLRLGSIAHYQELKSEYRDYVQLASQTSRRDAELLSMQRTGQPVSNVAHYPAHNAGHSYWQQPAPPPQSLPNYYSTPQYGGTPQFSPPAPAPTPDPLYYSPQAQFPLQAPAPAPAASYQTNSVSQYQAAPAQQFGPQLYPSATTNDAEAESPVPAPDPAEQFGPPSGASLSAPISIEAENFEDPVPPTDSFSQAPAPGSVDTPVSRSTPSPAPLNVQPTFVAPQNPAPPIPYGNTFSQPQPGYPQMPATPTTHDFGAQPPALPGYPQQYSQPMPYPQPQYGTPYSQGNYQPQGTMLPPQQMLPPQGAMPYAPPQPGPAPQPADTFSQENFLSPSQPQDSSEPEMFGPQSNHAPAPGQLFAPPAPQMLAPPSAAPPATTASAPQFDGAGIVQRSATAAPGQPQHVLLTPNGRVLAYLQGEPGVNLDSFVGQPMGLFGQRSHRPDLSADMLSVRGATPVRLKAPAAN